MLENESSSVEPMVHNYVIAKPADISSIRPRNAIGSSNINRPQQCERQKRYSRSPKKQQLREVQTFNISSITKIVLLSATSIALATIILGYGIHHSMTETTRKFEEKGHTDAMLNDEMRSLQRRASATARHSRYHELCEAFGKHYNQREWRFRRQSC
jgi:hypothetical protein